MKRNESEGRDIIFFAGIDWAGGNKMPCHHVVEGLARRHRIFYIDNFGGIRDLRLSDLGRAFRKLKGGGGRDDEPRAKPQAQAAVPPRIVVDRPIIVPTPRTRSLQVFNGWILNRRIRRLFRRHNIADPIIWTRLPIELVWRAIAGVDRSLLIYQMIDKFPEHPKIAPGLRARHGYWERRFSEEADLIFTSARGLWEEKRAINPESYFFPNGVSEIFRRTEFSEKPARERVPVVGFAGAVGTSLNMEWVAEVARLRPNFKFVFLGTIDPEVDVSELRILPNVRLEGRVEHDALPEWFGGFDAAIMAYRVNEYQRYTFPSKMAEYLLAGLPVVSNRLPEIEPYADIVRIVETPKEMAEGLDRAIEERTDRNELRKRKEFGESLTWDRIIEEMEEIISGKMGVGS